MYSGTTLNKTSGRIMGAHQKIDRVARGHLTQLLGDDSLFPKAGKILHFEGINGPDGIKKKSPGENEPLHFFNPFDETDREVVDLIVLHYKLLVKELKAGNKERVAFEAAWLAHTIVDGLTPAHHYPYEEKLAELRGGQGNETRKSFKEKVILPGETRRQQVKNNWKMWGPKGLLMSHGLFEIGIAAIIAPLTFPDSKPSHGDINQFLEIGIEEWFTRTAREIAVLDMFVRYHKKGWTGPLTVQVRNKLIPDIIKHVTLAWYCAMVDAKVIQNL
jgi:hypothetical protein